MNVGDEQRALARPVERALRVQDDVLAGERRRERVGALRRGGPGRRRGRNPGGSSEGHGSRVSLLRDAGYSATLMPPSITSICPVM